MRWFIVAPRPVTIIAGPAVFMDNTVGGATFGAFFGGVMAGTTNTSY